MIGRRGGRSCFENLMILKAYTQLQIMSRGAAFFLFRKIREHFKKKLEINHLTIKSEK